MAVLGNEHDAGDEAQNTWWKVFLHIDLYKEESPFTTWLTRITLNQCLMRIRRERRLRCYSLDAKPAGKNHANVYLRDPAPHPESAFLRRDCHDRLHSELRRIPKVLREILTLCDMEELSTMEAAARLGLSISAAKSRLRRGRQELRQRLLSLDQASSRHP